MEQSKHSQEILKLGKKIVNELKQESNSNFLNNWMAYYTAEKITLLENEQIRESKEELEKEISELILKIWDRKKQLYGNLNPLKELKQAIEIIKILSKDQNDFWRVRGKDISIEIISEFVSVINSSSFKMLQIALLMSLLPDKIIKTNEWLKDAENILQPQEKGIIENLKLFFDEIDFIKIVYKNEESEEIENEDSTYQEKALNKIDELLSRQLEAFTMLKEKIKK